MNINEAIRIQFTDIITLLKKISPEDYQKGIRVLSGKSIGQHIRHIIDFYHCLVRSLEYKTICYDERSRNGKLETDLHMAIDNVKKLPKDLAAISLEKEVELHYNAGLTASSSDIVKTTYKRELLFVYEHTIHHMALIHAAMVSEFPRVKLSQNFGKAASTIRNEKQNAICAQ